jgi:ABC-2 type transport system permease protein
VFAGLGALTLEGGLVPTALQWVARLTPSGALTEALSRAMTLSVDWFGLAVLAAWGVVAALCALRWFRFT